jgi:hypothetical protein
MFRLTIYFIQKANLFLAITYLIHCYSHTNGQDTLELLSVILLYSYRKRPCCLFLTYTKLLASELGSVSAAVIMSCVIRRSLKL